MRWPSAIALNRKDIARYSSSTSLRRILEANYPLHILRRIQCIFVDEREYAWFNALDGRLSLLEGTTAADLERVEVLEFPGEHQLFMARVYTRRFFRMQVGMPEQLGDVSMSASWGGVFCR